uniref:Uncharacterized protein n=1 Tax=Pyxicephalus adspersus TaxID=30357 RepID=A0AAV3AB40_PYXAD|nr:TPA: hypothetical protein GDO54_008828 [Pyxicephalus adspersus]
MHLVDKSGIMAYQQHTSCIFVVHVCTFLAQFLVQSGTVHEQIGFWKAFCVYTVCYFEYDLTSVLIMICYLLLIMTQLGSQILLQVYHLPLSSASVHYLP